MIRRIALIITILVVVQGCAPKSELRPMLDGYPGTVTHSSATATFNTPKGWHIDRKTDRGVGRVTLRPDDGSNTTIEILFSRPDPTGALTSESQTEAYLRAIHSKTDDEVAMKEEARVRNPHHGMIPIYSLTSDYFGYRLYADCLSPPVSLSAELYSESPKVMDSYLETFLFLVASLQVKQPRGEQAVDGNPH